MPYTKKGNSSNDDSKTVGVFGDYGDLTEQYYSTDRTRASWKNDDNTVDPSFNPRDNISGFESKWEIKKQLGKGSFGTVYEISRNIGSYEEHDALKIISVPASENELNELRYNSGYDDDSLRAYFKSSRDKIEAEYAMMSRLSRCPNIVNCKDFKTEMHRDGIGWEIEIRMELLNSLVTRYNALSDEREIAKLGVDICNALIACKKEGVVHRDIKPNNILVSPDGVYKLGDFGIARTMESTTGGTRAGTYAFMAPEVYKSIPYNATVDIYSLGMVLYWFLNDKKEPFTKPGSQRPTASELEEARQTRFSGKSIPEPVNGSKALKQIILKACQYNPKNRYSDPAEMKRDLESFLSGGSINGGGGKAKSKIIYIAAACALVVCCLILVLYAKRLERVVYVEAIKSEPIQTQTPAPTVEPTPDPMPKATSTPVPTKAPVSTPAPTVEPTPDPTPKATSTPVPTIEPTPAPLISEKDLSSALSKLQDPPTASEYLDEYYLATLNSYANAYSIHKVAETAASPIFSISHGAKVIVIAYNKGNDRYCVIVEETGKAGWVNADYIADY